MEKQPTNSNEVVLEPVPGKPGVYYIHRDSDLAIEASRERVMEVLLSGNYDAFTRTLLLGALEKVFGPMSDPKR